MKLYTARVILDTESPLSDEQVARCISNAADDAAGWVKAAADDELPDFSTMEIDWWIDEDLREAGVCGEGMQQLSFAIAMEKAAIA